MEYKQLSPTTSILLTKVGSTDYSLQSKRHFYHDHIKSGPYAGH